MCKDEQKPELETCYEKKELRSYVHEKKSSGAMFMKRRAPELCSWKEELRSYVHEKKSSGAGAALFLRRFRIPVEKHVLYNIFVKTPIN